MHNSSTSRTFRQFAELAALGAIRAKVNFLVALGGGLASACGDEALFHVGACLFHMLKGSCSMDIITTMQSG